MDNEDFADFSAFLICRNQQFRRRRQPDPRRVDTEPQRVKQQLRPQSCSLSQLNKRDVQLSYLHPLENHK